MTVPGIEVTDEEIDAQVDRLRDQSGELDVGGPPGARRRPRDHRPARDAAAGRGPRTSRTTSTRSGAGSEIAGLDDQLRGAKAGDILQFTAPVAGTDGAEEQAQFRVLVKDVKEKVLPEPTDEWAAEARSSTRWRRCATTCEVEAAADQGGAGPAGPARARRSTRWSSLVADDPPEALVDAEVRERLHDLGHRLEAAAHLRSSSSCRPRAATRTSLLAELRAEAARAVRADLALRALADAEDIEVTDEELDEAVAEMAEQAGTTAADLRRRLDRAGRLPAVRSDRGRRRRSTWLLDHVDLVDEDGKPVSTGRPARRRRSTRSG